jgi:hypothetical protein
VLYCYEGRLSNQGQFPGSTAAGGGVTPNSLAAHSVEHTSASAVTGEDSQSTAPDLVTGTSSVSCLGDSARSAGVGSSASAFSSSVLAGSDPAGSASNFSESLKAARLRVAESKAKLFGYFDEILSGRRGVMRVKELASLCDVKPGAVKAWAIECGGLEIIRCGRLGYCVHRIPSCFSVASLPACELSGASAAPALFISGGANG